MTGAGVTGELDAAVRALDAVLDALVLDPAAAGWSGAAADTASRAGAGLRGRGTGLAVRAHDLADAVRAALAALPPGPLAAADPRRDTVDARLVTALQAALAPAGAGPARGPRGPDPATVAAWWAGLTPAERERLVRERPDLVGGLDGVGFADRDRANRARLAAAEAAALAAVHADPSAPARRRLDRLAAVRASSTGPERHLLVLEVEGDRVRAAVADGDLDAARHVGVFTPGFTADAGDLPGRLGELGALRARAGPDTAVVAWYGYDAPRWGGLLDPATSVLADGPARGGGARLAGFLDGIEGARPAESPHVTVLGHSYGSLTAAQALGTGADGVDDAVLLGSPGVAPAPDVAPGHLWVAEAARDPVADAGWFGPDPNGVTGTVGLSTREVVRPDGAVLAGVEGHSAYLQPGSTSAHNVAAVVAGRPGEVVLDRGAGAGDRLRRLLEVPAR